MKTTLGHSLSQRMEVVCNGKSAAGRETMFLKVRNFLNSAVNNQGEGLKRSFWTSTLFFFFLFFSLCSLLFRANNRSAATKHESILFGDGEDGGLVLLVNLEDRETSNF